MTGRRGFLLGALLAPFGSLQCGAAVGAKAAVAGVPATAVPSGGRNEAGAAMAASRRGHAFDPSGAQYNAIQEEMMTVVDRCLPPETAQAARLRVIALLKAGAAGAPAVPWYAPIPAPADPLRRRRQILQATLRPS